MKIKIISIGKIKEEYMRIGIEDYKKRISKYCDIEIIELKEENINDENNVKNIKTAIDNEAKKIINYISAKDFVFALDRKGKSIDTLEFFELVKNKKNLGFSDFIFIIGSSYGLSDLIIEKANFVLSFSKFTFPHQLFRLILLEQIYRIFKIENNETYHK